ncbi:translation initiation factor IF-6 [Halalkalicoccus subterraneus]|uniref:translation initiation factor IF-6 n=1 Tax=Halalkalicoccus subterraneus TaxID=2675002 RepID=UPI000EFBC080|nr:translation initiation factor IF-6 [Halalkalicoccus subterraneus]
MLRTAFFGSSSVGVFASATDDALLVRNDVEDDLREELEEELGVSTVATTIGGASTVGALCVGNSKGLLVSSRITGVEREAIGEVTELPITELPGKINAAGNVVLANDSGAYVHPDLSREAVKAITEGLDVPVERGEIAGLRTVGTAAVATDEGVLCHPKATDGELDFLEEHLGVYADIGTINYGAPLVGAGLVANEFGYVAGRDTTGPELGRIEDTLGYLD